MGKLDSGGWTAADARERRERQEGEFLKSTSMNGVIVYDGSFAGIAGFRDINWWNASCEMGIILSPSFWGKQLCTEVHRMCLSYAFETLRLNRIEFKTACSNAGMVGFLTRFGAAQEGVLRDYFPVGPAGYADVALFSILASDWPEVRAALEARLWMSNRPVS